MWKPGEIRLPTRVRLTRDPGLAGQQIAVLLRGEILQPLAERPQVQHSQCDQLHCLHVKSQSLKQLFARLIARDMVDGRSKRV